MHIKIKVNRTAGPALSEAVSFEPDSYPTLVVCKGSEGAFIKFQRGTMYTYIGPAEWPVLERMLVDDYEDKAATPGFIDSNTLLKAIAITKDANLATQLIKD